MRKLILLSAMVILSINLFADMSDSYDKTTDARKIGWMDKGKEAVSFKLKDSDSAKFRNVYFHRGSDNIPMTCGEVNSKNSYGAYIGFQRFISAGTSENTYLEEQVSGFSDTWNRFCK